MRLARLSAKPLGGPEPEAVANYSSRNLPTYFKVSGLWAGQTGSLLFWLLILMVFASICILVGMWLERFLIIIPTLTHPFLTYNHSTYWPSLTEASIAAGTLGLFLLLYVLFAKFSPMISIWEIEEGYTVAKHSIESHHPASLGSRVADDIHPAH